MDAEIAKWWADKNSVPYIQAAVYTMCGGGFLGSSAARCPADFYIDTRCGKLPYTRRRIMTAVKQLVEIATAAGLDPKNLPEIELPNLGVF
jgi:hypothetical protein